jgi:hypothetical protein
MTLNLITEEEYNLILDIYADHPNLTYANTGYDYPDKSKWTLEEFKSFTLVESILRKAIVGFREFNHFKNNGKSGKLKVRFQYDYSADLENGIPFTGVGYLEVEELYKGFKQNEK